MIEFEKSIGDPSSDDCCFQLVIVQTYQNGKIREPDFITPVKYSPLLSEQRQTRQAGQTVRPGKADNYARSNCWHDGTL